MFSDKIKQLRENALGRLNPQQRQWALLGGIGVGFGTVMWLMFVIGDSRPEKAPVDKDPIGISAKTPPTPILAAGQPVRPADAWIAMAGKDVDQLKKDREDARAKIASQERANKDMMARFEELQKKLNQVQNTKAAAPVAPAPASATNPEPAAAPAAARAKLPPLPPPPRTSPSGGGPAAMSLPFGEPGGFVPQAPAASLVRVSLGDSAGAAGPIAAAVAAAQQKKPEGGPQGGADPQARSLDNFLPISFTRAVLLGGLDAPTGGQSQSNPHPVLLRLEDNAVLPNRFRAQVRECFVVGAGYGDLSSERAYIRTERLSCTRTDGTPIEIRIKGSIFGEDGKVGVRGRLVSKQGQVLANALIAGVMSGIGAGVQARFSIPTNSATGASSMADPNHVLENGMGQGIGKAMDRLAQYYITLAEKMFPIIEVDAGRLVDVVLTEGAVLDVPLVAHTPAPAARPSSNYYRGQAPRLRTIGAGDED